MHRNSIIFISSIVFLVALAFFLWGDSRVERVTEETTLHSHDGGPLHRD